MATLNIRGLTLGAGAPKLCAPILGAEEADILPQARALGVLPIDMAEWRFDGAREGLRGSGWTEGLGGLMANIRAALGEETPLIFTYRTAAELAGSGMETEDYAPVLRAAIESGRADLVDIELARGGELAKRLGQEARAVGAKALFSLHDFRGTPPAQEMADALLRMEDLGADVAKLAVTPRKQGDVLALFSAMEQAEHRLGIPFAAMGMGKLGMLTRLGGGLFGAAFTFGAGQKESAPGQPPVRELRAALELLYGD